MTKAFDVSRFKSRIKPADQYARQLKRIESAGQSPRCIEAAVTGAMSNLAAGASAIVIYGEPQSGKTEMMICLTAKLLDEGWQTIIHLMNDSVDLLSQNLRRFKESGLAPAPRNSTEWLKSTSTTPQALVLFCKKNARDLEKVLERLSGLNGVVVIDDEADYATPHSKVNKGAKTAINQLVESLLGGSGRYIGVTATPARLDLNQTFDNDTGDWVEFPAHGNYTGQDVFFPLVGDVRYRLVRIGQGGTAKETNDALLRFLVTAAYLNVGVNAKEENYTMLVHTSGKKNDHELDRATIEEALDAIKLQDGSVGYLDLAAGIHATARKLFPDADANDLLEYVLDNASRANLVVLNSERDRIAAGDAASVPSSPFTVIIGGNIVSRGVTFPNLLSMYFTRDVSRKLQQDTYIQRARMFGARGAYLQHFELTIPAQLYADWHRCFLFHRLALEMVRSDIGSPVWIGDKRIAVASRASISKKATVSVERGEMSFAMFDYKPELDAIALKAPTEVATVAALQVVVGERALPRSILDFINAIDGGKLAIHPSRSIMGMSDADHAEIARPKSVIGNSDLELTRFPDAAHHLKAYFNDFGKARYFYKYTGDKQLVQRSGGAA